MQITTILLIFAAVLTFLSGIAVFAGITKKERVQGIWFFLMTLGTAIWSIAIGVFLALPEDATTIAPGVLFALYTGAMLMLAAFVGYVGWSYTGGRILTIIYCAVGIILSFVLALNPSVLYGDITLSRLGNSIKIVDGWFYWIYIAFCILTAITMLGFTLYHSLRAKKQRERSGMTVLLIGTSIAGIILSIFDLFLPPERYDLIWIGPLATSLNILCFYYAILRFHVMTLSTNWLKILSYIIIMMTGAMIYMIVFFAIFTAIFHTALPSPSVLILNFTMAIIVLLFIPAISEISTFIRSLIDVQTVDIVYVFKKLSHIKTKDLDLYELASFLSDHLHFEYVGFLIDGRLYSSITLPLSADELKEISALPTKDQTIWQDCTNIKQILPSQRISMAAELHNIKGQPFGQIIFGPPLSNVKFTRQELIQLAMVINLLSTIVEHT